MAGGDDLSGGTPIGLADCDSIGKGAPSLDHRPGLAGGEELGGKATNSMGDVSSCGVALAGKARAGMAEQSEAAIQRFNIESGVVELGLLDPGAEFVTDAAPGHYFVEKGVSVGSKQSTGSSATVMRFGNVGIVIARDELHDRNALKKELFDVV